MGFISSGWNIVNGIVLHPPGMDDWRAYRFIIEAIYDGHLPVTRVIGYSYRTDAVSKSGIFRRSKGSLEDKMSLASKLTKILVFGENVTRARTAEMAGTMTIDNMGLMYSGKPITAISSQPNILTSTTTASLEFIFSTSTGYVDASVNYTKVIAEQAKRRGGNAPKSTRFLPVFSYHNIIDFVRILPYMEDGVVHMKYDNGMTDALLIELFENMFNGSFDIEWESNYREVFSGASFSTS